LVKAAPAAAACAAAKGNAVVRSTLQRTLRRRRGRHALWLQGLNLHQSHADWHGRSERLSRRPASSGKV
jgi:hypothetical protein